MFRRLLIVALALAACGSPETPPFRRVAVADLDGIERARFLPAIAPFLASCSWLTRDDPLLGAPEKWAGLCARAEGVKSEEEAAAFFRQEFDAILIDGGEVLVTGYFEPVFEARETPEGRFTAPVLGPPDDLVSVDLGAFREDLGGRRIAGRVEAGKLVPYADRQAIAGMPPESSAILGYMQPDDLFFLQIQGSGVLAFPDGLRRIGYAAQNGHPYKAIGRSLVEEGHLALEDVTMQSIREWLLAATPEDAARIRATNPSYVFFEGRGPLAGDEGPRGTAGVPLTPEVSVAIDRTVVPLGAPVFLHGTDDSQVLTRLAVAQDTGGAIRGAGRADLFLGRGDEAGEAAGRLKLKGRMAVLVPKGAPLPAAAPKS